MFIPAPAPLITLTSDFGTRDGYTGAMKGVIQQVAPHTRMVDITHEIPAGDIRSGAWALRTALPFFPRGTVHVAVIDPGVGTDRHAIVVLADHQFLIGPDNGLFSWILEEAEAYQAWKLSDDSWSPVAGSHTFHGRDLFSHAAALMVREGDLDRICGEQVEPQRAKWARALPAVIGAAGEVVHVDHFGNVITNLLLPSESDSDSPMQVQCGDTVFQGLNRTYGDVPEGEGLLLVGSHNFLEIAVRQGSAAERFGLRVGDQVAIGLQASGRSV
jgi:S-adenosylmethionine hydrolase